MKRVLIANRGEIAVRIARACRCLGLGSVAVYSEADAEACHVRAADKAVGIGPAEAARSYLNIAKLIAAAEATGADAIHPGYGFLSENPFFARAVEEAGLIWVGPPAASIEPMNSKTEAKAVVRQAGVPCMPAAPLDDLSPASVGAAADCIGYPLLVKPEHGGGGKGMQRVYEPTGLSAAVTAAQRIARAAFASDRLFVEHLIEPARHIEVQILADRQGRTEHLFERDCTIQRRHQKVLEESPCPVLNPQERKRIWKSACAIVRQINYVGAGTVEFLFDPVTRDYYFLEMNTRIQVEHPVTEAVSGVDLVVAQLRIADGETLDSVLADRVPSEAHGHAIEARIYAEDPQENYLPQAGRLCRLRWPALPFVRVDAGYEEGDRVSEYYDPLLAKIIAWGPDRKAARERLIAGLRETVIHGVRTNVPMLLNLLQHLEFRDSQVHTSWLEEITPAIATLSETTPDLASLAAVAVAGPGGPLAGPALGDWPPAAQGAEARGTRDPWTRLHGFRICGGREKE